MESRKKSASTHEMQSFLTNFVQTHGFFYIHWDTYAQSDVDDLDLTHTSKVENIHDVDILMSEFDKTGVIQNDMIELKQFMNVKLHNKNLVRSARRLFNEWCRS